MKKKKRVSIDPNDKETARKSLDEIAKESNQIIGDDINGGWMERIAPPKKNDDEQI